VPLQIASFLLSNASESGAFVPARSTSGIPEQVRALYPLFSSSDCCSDPSLFRRQTRCFMPGVTRLRSRAGGRYPPLWIPLFLKIPLFFPGSPREPKQSPRDGVFSPASTPSCSSFSPPLTLASRKRLGSFVAHRSLQAPFFNTYGPSR